jgi:hypothetical protein
VTITSGNPEPPLSSDQDTDAHANRETEQSLDCLAPRIREFVAPWAEDERRLAANEKFLRATGLVRKVRTIAQIFETEWPRVHFDIRSEFSPPKERQPLVRVRLSSTLVGFYLKASGAGECTVFFFTDRSPAPGVVSRLLRGHSSRRAYSYRGHAAHRPRRTHLAQTTYDSKALTNSSIVGWFEYICLSGERPSRSQRRGL